MRTTNNLFRRVHNCTHFKWWFTQFERKCNILEIFHYFQYFERFRSMKKWQISKPKIVDWYLDFSKESYITLKSVISSFKICFQNYGKLERKFLKLLYSGSEFNHFKSVSCDELSDLVPRSTLKSCMLDPITASVLKNCYDLLLPFITKVVNCSLQNSTLTSDRKRAIVRPSLKKPSLDYQLYKNHRPPTRCFSSSAARR